MNDAILMVKFFDKLALTKYAQCMRHPICQVVKSRNVLSFPKRWLSGSNGDFLTMAPFPRHDLHQSGVQQLPQTTHVPSHQTVVLRGLKAGTELKQIEDFLNGLSCLPKEQLRLPRPDKKAPGLTLVFLNFESPAAAARAVEIFRTLPVDSLPPIFEKGSYNASLKWPRPPRSPTTKTAGLTAGLPGDVIPDGLENFIRSQYRRDTLGESAAGAPPPAAEGRPSPPAPAPASTPVPARAASGGGYMALFAAALVRIDAWESSGILPADQAPRPAAERPGVRDADSGAPGAAGRCGDRKWSVGTRPGAKKRRPRAAARCGAAAPDEFRRAARFGCPRRSAAHARSVGRQKLGASELHQ